MSTSLPITASIPSIRIKLSVVPLMFCRAPESITSTRRIFCRSRFPLGGDPFPTEIILSCARLPGIGLKMEPGAIRPIKTATSPAAATCKRPSNTSSRIPCRIADFQPAAIVPCRMPASATGKAIHISPANSPAKATRSIRNGWLSISRRRSK